MEFVWVQRSLSEKSAFEILRIVLFTELSFNIARIPTAILLSKTLTYRGNPYLAVFRFLLVLTFGIICYRFVGVYIVLQSLYDMELTEITIFSLASMNSAGVNVILCSVIYISFVQYRRGKEARLNEEVLRKQNLENELKFLKAQINPHFLFNTLNNLYGLARSQDSRTPEVILKLSDLMRFMLYKSNVRSVSLATELDVLSKYIALEEIRYSDRLSISFIQKIENEAFSIAPLLLVHLVENAFKHGVSESTKNALIEIQIIQKDERCAIKITNTKAEIKTEKREKIGLSNIKRQLDLMYKNYELDIRDGSDTFEIVLNLPHSFE